MRKMLIVAGLALVTTSIPGAALAQLSPSATWAAHAANQYQVFPNITYLTANIDTACIVLTGESAGGHLTLTTGMIPESAGLDRECASNTPMPKVAAMVNWYGITDVADVIDGPHKANAAVRRSGCTRR